MKVSTPGCRAALLVALAWVTSGCNAGRAFVASPNDYADYRRVRAARTLDERLAAASAYLAARPDGRYAPRLRAYFDEVEPLYFKVKAASLPGLERYLAVLPRGPHAREALDTLMGRRDEVRRGDITERAARATRLRVERENKARANAAALALWWLRAGLDPHPWHGTFSDAPAEFLARFRLSAPAPECSRDEGGQVCTKAMARTFRVRSPSGEVERSLGLTVTVRLDREYHLEALELSGERFALASDEAARGVSGAGGDAAAHEAWQALLGKVSETVLGDGRICNGGEDAQGGLHLDCDEPNVVVDARRGADGREVIALRRRPGLKGTRRGGTTSDHER